MLATTGLFKLEVELIKAITGTDQRSSPPRWHKALTRRCERCIQHSSRATDPLWSVVKHHHHGMWGVVSGCTSVGQSYTQISAG